MKIAVIGLVLLGIFAAACAAVLMATLSGPEKASATGATDPDVEVLLASKDMPAMSVVDGTCVITKKVPRSQVPEYALLNPVQVVGKVITERMVANQPFTKNCFPRDGVGVYLASAVPPGKRAMSVQLTDWSGMAGLLYPGSVVDVLVSYKTLGMEGTRNDTEMVSTTLLQGLQVLAIGSQSIADSEYKDKDAGALAARGQMNFRMITLLVEPKQAEILQLATLNGSISLSMRNPLDTKHDVQRATRAREISPLRASLGLTVAEEPEALATDSNDPFDDGTKPQAAASTENKPVPEGMWETTIVRGSAQEKRQFPMQDARQPAGDE